MLKVLIVDDEPLMVDVLKSIVNWEELGFAIAGEAYNGEEALKVINSKHVDVVLTDLKMPVMNGLDLIRNACVAFPDIKFVVVSAYDDFSMVSTAFKLGVQEYILKDEMTSRQIVNVFKSVQAKIRQEEENKKQAEKRIVLEQEAYLNTQRLKNYIDQNQGVIKEKILSETIWGESKPGETRYELSGLRFRPDSRRKCILNICIDDYMRLENQVWEGNSELLNFKIMSILEEILEKQGIGDVFRKANGQYVIILCFNNILSESCIREKIHIIGNDAARCLETGLHVHITCGASETAGEGKNLQKQYNQAYIAGRYSFIKGKDRIIHYDSLPKGSINFASVISEKISRLKELFANMEHEDSQELVQKLCLEDSRVLPGNVSDARELYEKYYLYISDFIEQKQMDDTIREGMKRFANYLKEYGSLKEMNEWLAGTLNFLAAAVGEGNQLINRAKKYIHRHYKDNISLSDVADELGVNSSYLSRTFAAEAGCSLMDYIAKVRMEVAVNYMKNTDLKIYEIADKVGYMNAEHFSRMFKKVLGKSPREFANQNQAKPGQKKLE